MSGTTPFNLTQEEYRLMVEKPEISKVYGTKAGIFTTTANLDSREYFGFAIKNCTLLSGVSNF
jgi:hypothetical protein